MREFRLPLAFMSASCSAGVHARFADGDAEVPMASTGV